MGVRLLLAEAGEERLDLRQALLDGVQRLAVAALLYHQRRPGAGVHHRDVRAVLLQHQPVLLVGGELAAEVQHPQVAGRVPHHAAEFLQHEQAQVAVVVHHRLLPQRLAVGAGDLEAELRAVAAAVVGQLVFEVVQQRLAPVRPYAVGAADQLHLEQAQVQPHLELRPAVQAVDLADVDRAGLVIPAAEDRGDVLAGELALGPLGAAALGTSAFGTGAFGPLAAGLGPRPRTGLAAVVAGVVPISPLVSRRFVTHPKYSQPWPRAGGPWEPATMGTQCPQGTRTRSGAPARSANSHEAIVLRTVPPHEATPL